MELNNLQYCIHNPSPHFSRLSQVGISSLAKFRLLGKRSPLMKKQFDTLLRGCILYWLVFPAIIFAVTRSFFFLVCTGTPSQASSSSCGKDGMKVTGRSEQGRDSERGVESL